MIVNLLKGGLLLVYLGAIAGQFGLLAPNVAQLLRNASLIVLVVHLIELPIAWRHLRRHPGGMAASIALTLLFGLLHWKALVQRKDASGR